MAQKEGNSILVRVAELLRLSILSSFTYTGPLTKLFHYAIF